MQTTTPFLMFTGQAAQAIESYATWFSDFELLMKQMYPDNGQIAMAKIRINNQVILLNDTLQKHEFDFTPSFSFFIECQCEQEIHQLVQHIEQNGESLMPLANYGFSTLFAWCNDQYGVSWQISYTEKTGTK